MPLFSKAKGSPRREAEGGEAGGAAGSGTALDTHVQKAKLVFHCQQAQGSPTGIISDFSNIKELYQQIANCYDFPPEEVRAIERR
jgi:hypothetical protein